MQVVQYTLNGDYEAVQDATRTTFTNTLSWLDLTSFQVDILYQTCETISYDKGEAFEGVLCDLPGQLFAGSCGLENLRGQD